MLTSKETPVLLAVLALIVVLMVLASHVGSAIGRTLADTVTGIETVYEDGSFTGCLPSQLCGRGE